MKMTDEQEKKCRTAFGNTNGLDQQSYEWGYQQACLDAQEQPSPAAASGEGDRHARNDAWQLVQEQANDAGLWFQAATAPEAYLQQELRRLHTQVEHDLAHFAPRQGEAVCWVRTLDGKIDWSEDCLSSTDDSGEYDAKDGYASVPLYLAAPPPAAGMVMVSSKMQHELTEALGLALLIIGHPDDAVTKELGKILDRYAAAPKDKP